ncbi:MAG TPA: DUF3861 family protein [Acidobacteriaceae bacterium]|jgi:hypothetical protein
MPAYRITVEALDPTPGEGGHESISFFASTPHDILTTANNLRVRLDCSACHATKLAVGLILISDPVYAHLYAHHRPALFTESTHESTQELQSIDELLASPEVATAKAKT